MSVKYNVTLEHDDNGNISGIKIGWKTANGTEIEELVITNSSHLEELETRISEIVSNTLRPAEVLKALSTVDGENSGLDADTWRGLLPSHFSLVDHNHDTRYYTKAEIDAIVKSLGGTSSGGSTSGGTTTGGGTTTVTKTDPTVRISGPSEVALGGNYTLQATVPSDATGTVTFFVNNSVMTGNYEATISNGVATVTNAISSNEGSWSYTCRYNGNDKYNAKDSENSITVSAIDTKKTGLSGAPTTVTNGSFYNITLKDYKGNPIAGKHIDFACTATLTTGEIFTKTYYGTTDESGVATPQVAWTYSATGWNGATIEVVSTFAGDSTYSGCSNTTKVTYKT